MIPRYSRPEMTAIWSQEQKYQNWLDIERLACEKMGQIGMIPAHVAQSIAEKGGFDPARIDDIEREVKHDVIAFLTNLAEYVGDDARYIHQGMTSSDVVDTGFAMMMVQSVDLILADLEDLLAALEKQAKTHKHTICIGRSHGVHGEPTTFGLKMAGHYAAFQRSKNRLLAARAEIAICNISGAVGTYATLDPSIEIYVAEKLGLQPETIATQVTPRDRHAMLACVLGVIASSIENLVIEIRHLQRTEVREAEEFFSKGQKGSSAMPHKRNPILSENLTGLARIIRSTVIPALENVALWHERDISHSSVERVSVPDAFIALDFSLVRLTKMINELLVYPDRMKKNMDMTGGLIFSQRALLALTQAGISREDAYALIQSHAMHVWESDGASTLKQRLLEDRTITNALSLDQITAIFQTDFYLKQVDFIFNRVFNKADYPPSHIVKDIL
jgi:adenylosuccinate lyase